MAVATVQSLLTAGGWCLLYACACTAGGEPLLTSSVSTCTEPGLVVPQQHANLLQQRQSAASNPESAASNPGAVVCQVCAAAAFASRQSSLAAHAPPPLLAGVQVAGCMADLTHCKSYCIKKRACVKHMQADVVYLSAADTTPWRFCQQVCCDACACACTRLRPCCLGAACCECCCSKLMQCTRAACLQCGKFEPIHKFDDAKRCVALQDPGLHAVSRQWRPQRAYAHARWWQLMRQSQQLMHLQKS